MTPDHRLGYTKPPRAGDRGFPRGPLGYVGEGHPKAIGFCDWCGTNARRTTATRGVFVCPTCVHVWYDDRVGRPTLSFTDFFAEADQ